MRKKDHGIGQIKSAVVIARLLKTEGFTPYLANCIRKYALSLATNGQRRRWTRVKKAFSELMRDKVTEAEKKLIGVFIGTMQRMAFETGLRVGLGALTVSANDVQPWDLNE